MTHHRHPDQLRFITWTAVLLQLVHLALATMYLLRLEADSVSEGLGRAIPAGSVYVIGLPAVFLWGTYASFAYTRLGGNLSFAAKAGLVVGITVALCAAEFAFLMVLGTVFAVLYAPH